MSPFKASHHPLCQHHCRSAGEPTCALHGSHSNARTLRASTSSFGCGAGGKKALIFCSTKGKEKCSCHFPISTCQAAPQPQSVGKSICQSQHTESGGRRSVYLYLCVLVLCIYHTHTHTLIQLSVLVYFLW